LPTQDLDGQGEGIESLPPDKRNLAFDIIRKVRDKLKPEVAKVKSQADYARKFSRLTSKLGEPGLKPDVEIWTASLAPYLDAPNSFRANRAALLFGLRDRMRRAMAAQDSIRRNRGAAINWLKQVLLLQSLDKILSHVEASPRDAAFWASKVGKRRHGTRKKTRLGDH
jgi:hypothetical protein